MQVKSTRGVQQEEVSLAADALLVEQVKPTIERIRMKLGRGSPNTVGPMLDAWFSTLGERLGVSSDSDINDAPPTELHIAMHAMWKTALSAAKVSLESTQASFLATLSEQTQRLDIEMANIQAERIAFNEKEVLINESLQLAKWQLQSANEQIHQMRLLLDKKETELKQAHDVLHEKTQELNEDRRRTDEQAKEHREEIRLLSRRFEATERRLMVEIDRERQLSRKSFSKLDSAQNEFSTEKAKLQDAARQIGKKLHESEVENAALTERLSTFQLRINDLKDQIRSPVVTRKITTNSKNKRLKVTP